MAAEDLPVHSPRLAAPAKCDPCAPSVGRIGALAVALGIGSAMLGAGIAHADTVGADSSQSSTSGSAQTGSARSARHSSAGSSTARAGLRSDSPRSRSRTAPHSEFRPRAASQQRAAVAGITGTAGTGDSVRSTGTVAADTSVAAAPQTAMAASGPSSPVAVVTATIRAARSALESLVHNAKPPVVPSGGQLLMTLLAWTRQELESLFAIAASTKPTAATTGTTATATGTTTVTIEAESMAVAPAKAGSIYNDTAASGRKALLLSTNSTASKTLSLPSTTSLVIRARGDQYNGAPVMTVSVDGQVVATTQVSSRSWADYTIPVSVSAGTHTISIAFTNDLRQSASRDRNLRLDKITVVPATSSPTQTPSYFQAADWLWKPIVANPVLAADSATWVSYLAASNAQRVADLYEYGVTLIPASEITSSTPRYDVMFAEPWGSDPFGSYTVPIPTGVKLPSGSDSAIAILDPTTGKAFGIWQASYNSTTNMWSGSWGGMTDLSGDGVDTSGSATATNIARYAGVITAAEFSAAVTANTGINHALFVSSDIAGALFASPATKSDGTNIAGVAVPIPEGTRIQLDPSIDIDAIPGITAAEKVIAKTLQTYGAYIGDQGGARMAFGFEVVADATSSMNPGAVWTNAGLEWDYYDMAAIPWSRLRVLASWDGSAGG